MELRCSCLINLAHFPFKLRPAAALISPSFHLSVSLPSRYVFGSETTAGADGGLATKLLNCRRFGQKQNNIVVGHFMSAQRQRLFHIYAL